MNQKPERRKWICPCTPLDKPVILYRDEFMMRLLAIAKSDDLECSISERLEIKFGPDRIYKVLGNQIVQMAPGISNDDDIQSFLENTEKTQIERQSSHLHNGEDQSLGSSNCG